MEHRKYAGFFLLGGHRLSDINEIESMLRRFWTRYQSVEEGMPDHPERTIGYFLHGDEGRGQGKRPLLVISYQTIIPWSGEDAVNAKQQLAAIVVVTARGCQVFFFRFLLGSCYLRSLGIRTQQDCYFPWSPRNAM